MQRPTGRAGGEDLLVAVARPDATANDRTTTQSCCEAVRPCVLVAFIFFAFTHSSKSGNFADVQSAHYTQYGIKNKTSTVKVDIRANK